MSLVAVIGSSGNVGFATIQALSEKGVAVRAGVRDTSTDKAKTLASLGNVDVVEASFGDIPSMTKAFTGASVAFVVSPGAEDRAALVSTAVEAAKSAGVKHLVVVSVPSVAAEGSPLFKVQFNEIESTVEKSGIKYTFLRLPMFFENQWASAGSIKGEGKIYGPADPNKKVSLVAVKDIADAAVTVLTNPESHVNQSYTLASDTVTFSEIASTFASATGNIVEYVQVPYDAAVEAMVGLGFPRWQAGGVAELLKQVDAEDPVAVQSTKPLESLISRKPTTFKAWVESVAGAFKA